MLIIYLYCVLFALQLGLLIYCSLKKSKRMWICQLVFQGLCIALAAGLCIYYECLPVYPGPILSLHMEGFISLFAAIVFAVLLCVGFLVFGLQADKEEE